jgi:hypothetical protein
MPPPAIDPREKEMAELRARYAKLRGKKVEEQPKEKVIKETVTQPQTPIKKTNPYIRLMQSDIENIINRIKKLLGLKMEVKSKPLNLSWLEKNDRRFWK